MSIDETASWCEMVGNAADDVLELEIDDMDIVENGEPNDKIEAEETQRTAILIVVHSNFRTYGGPRTREVSPDDIVGLFVGDVDTGRGHIFRISPHRQQPIPPQDRRARLSRAKSIYRDKFFNERNLVPFDSVETHMVDSVGCMLQLAAQFLAPYSTIYVKLPPQSSARYPDNFKGAVHGEGMKRRMQEMRVGAFVALDTLSDMVYPGPRERMLEYKKTKRSV